jgi:hypothetical protein
MEASTDRSWRVWMARASLEAAQVVAPNSKSRACVNAPSTRSYGGTRARSIPGPSSTVRASAAIVATPGSCLASLPAASAAGRTGDDQIQIEHAAHCIACSAAGTGHDWAGSARAGGTPGSLVDSAPARTGPGRKEAHSMAALAACTVAEEDTDARA